ncbi:cyclodeaminase/cyclohydrolase family protein [Nocardia asteroides NBRC 15531]|uniref:Hydrolase n=1 Tax=Nocardia asteroides NBRC 15531 TaxID=1110697 RepID=U5EGY3_NOCAS|nr:cyclodeaminase/cyclohydrolase family protein [Nocardia asteroides]TLF67560.1 cyclodeaminase/cyclohydrolase family protein [Nocardia asteroides NBRC 15531]UGT50938.1 cyclodeaminase/cyclohydrolase family protein [Nocardia asteroides]SFN44490.1 Formiminotetrahydrofolate cyclodeaminase [Nocardia asteroides]VEG36206.1 Methenyltetrahydrofolate cyclohydrolase [Nocardia asteroides]GAD85631.1 putative hydrolase [Nocardia asteroides NBRC 15531]
MSQPTASPQQTTPSFGAVTLEDYLSQLGAKVPAPGGGAVAALHAAQAAALVAMVARYTTRAKDAAHRPVVDRIIEAADAARTRSLALADADAAAFTAVGDAYKLPKDTEADQAARTEAINAALVEAARVPAAVVDEADEILSLAAELLPIGNPNVVTDIGAAADAARAAALSSQLNIEINVGSLPAALGDGFATALLRVETIAARADALHADVLHAVRG